MLSALYLLLTVSLHFIVECAARRPLPGIRRLLICGLSVLMLVVQPLPAQALDIDDREAVSIEADSLRYDQERRLFIADGNVLMLSESTKVTCDYAEYSDLTGSVVAQGAVTLKNAEGIVVCDRVEGNIRTRLWTFYNGEMDNVKRGYLLKGGQIDKTGDETYVIQGASVSECGKERPFWEMRGKRLSITRGKHLAGRHLSLRLGGIPLLYFPYFWYPLSTERQSGFLPPVLGKGGRNGSSVALDYFWAIDSDRDATFSYEYLADNGNRFGLEYRYAVNRDVGGALFGKYVHDRNADRDGSRIGMNQDRWEAGITHHVNMEDRLYGGAFVHVFSDGFYLQDFSRSSEARVQNNGQSDFALVSRRPAGNVTADFRYYQEMGVRRSTTTLQSLPELRFDLPGSRVGDSNWFLALESSFVNFYRQESYAARFSSAISADPDVLTPVTPDQINQVQRLIDVGFDPDVALRHQGVKGRRIDLFPHLSLPLDLAPGLVVTPHVGYRETLYSRESLEKDSVERGVFEMGVSGDVKFHRDYQGGRDRTFRHIVEPGITYAYRSDRNQDDVPIYDEIDQLDPRDEILLKLVNRIVAQVGDVNPAAPTIATPLGRREIATLKLEARYDRRLSEDRFRSVSSELDMNLSDNVYFEAKALYDFRTDDLEQANMDLIFRKDESLALQVGRRYTRTIPVDTNQPIGSGQYWEIGGTKTLQGIDNDGISFWTTSLHWAPTARLSMDFTGYFNAAEDSGDDLSFQIQYARKCWGVGVTWDRYDDTVFDDRVGQFDIDRVNEIHLVFTIKSLHLSF